MKETKNLKENLIEQIEELDVVFKMSLLSDIISYDGTFSDDYDYYENDEEFFETFYQGEVLKAVTAAVRGEYNPRDRFVKINAYGNLDSLDFDDVDNEIICIADEIADWIIENPNILNLSDYGIELPDDFDE